MADASHRRLADQASIADDDPFAELTRIMGFDPRQPISRPAAVTPAVAQAPVAAEAPAAEADFGLDLERELLGEFAENDEAAAMEAQPLPSLASDEHVEPMRPAAFEEARVAEPQPVQAKPAPDSEVGTDFDLSEEAYGAIELDASDGAAFATAAEASGASDHDLPAMETIPVQQARGPDRFETQVDLPPLPIGERATGVGASSAQAGTAASTAGAGADDIDMMLESELDALLGNVLPASVEPKATDHHVVLEPPAWVAEPQVDDRDAGFAGRFDALDPETGYDASDEFDGHAVEQHASSGFDADPLAAAASRWSAHAAVSEQQVQAAPSGDFDLSFDDAAFDTAIASGLNTIPAGNTVRTASERAETTENRADADMSRDGHDPYAALAALSADLKGSPSWKDAAPQSILDARGNAAPAFEAPDIDTVDVPEQAVSLADDLDLPEFTFEDAPASASSYDDIDAEFASLLNEMNALEAEVPAGSSRRAEASSSSVNAAREIRLDQPVDAYPDTAYGDDPRYADDRAFSEASRDGYAPARETAMADMDFAYDPDADEDVAPAYQSFAPKPSRSKGLMVAALVAGVAVLGGVGAFALSFGDSSSGEVALVKADPSPTKVRPENPGGATIPNQDNKVYDTVAGAGEVPEPTQKELVQSAETPMELPMPDDEADFADTDMDAVADAAGGAISMAETGTVKAEDRVEQIAAEAGVDATVEVAAVPPRKVRTMIVKADGTLVAREEAEPETTATAVDTASESIVDPAAVATVASTAAVAEEAPSGAAAVPSARAQNSAATPGAAPIAPARPSDQPVDIVGEVQPQQVAALAPAASGAWAMQIASQPSEAAAQASYQSLSRRYAGVLGGKQASIVKAEIAGKGTYWRVRVAAGSRNDAVKLCETYKAAGGSCFVSK